MYRKFMVLIAGLWLCADARSSHAQTNTGSSTRISRQQIASVLKQALPGAPQETGGGLLDGDHFRIGTLKRKLPGEVELHHNDTDIIYILSGKTTLVTGGVVEGMRDTSAAEARGTTIRNGVRHILRAGDMVVIPKNQPHWFQDVSGQVSYLVIKVQ